jgi:Sigma-70 region 2
MNGTNKSNPFLGSEMRNAASNPFAQITVENGGLTDEELVSRAQAGDEDALEKLVRRHQSWVFNIAIRMIWRRDLAEDATQEILIKIVTKLSTFRGQSSDLVVPYRGQSFA